MSRSPSITTAVKTRTPRAGMRTPARSAGLFGGYEPLPDTFDEFFDARGRPHAHAESVVQRLDPLSRAEYRTLQTLADKTFLRSGVTFSVYSGDADPDRIFPFDLIPRLVSGTEWRDIEKGLVQRIQALNAFLQDVYGPQRILDDGAVPREMVESSKAFLPAMRGVVPPRGVHVHIAGVDLIRDRDGRFLVLEDNIRTPSGVSYVLENRMMMKKVFPQIFGECAVAPVEMYPARLREAMSAVAPSGEAAEHNMVVLTPGPFNSAYFEHSFLARRMGCELVQGSDLFVENDHVYAKTTQGPRRVDVIYRRVDDGFLDPDAFKKDSMLGVPGLVRAYTSGNVALLNAIGNGVADDKGIYPFVPDMIRFYLSEEPILPQVPTYVCIRENDCRYVLDHLGELVVKAVNESGGYGMLVGPRSTKKQIAEFRGLVASNPRNYIAQPLVQLSACPTWTREGIGPRRVDLRPYIVTGASTWVLPGGLTRVARKKGSYVVNSSQGGGSKDTWVVEDGA